jgi:MFS family permease
MPFLTDLNRRWILFVLSTLLFVFSQFYRATIAVITPQLMADISLDTRGLGQISAAFFYAFALTQIPLALYLDRLGFRRTMVTLNMIAVLGAIVFATSQSLELLIFSRSLLGIGMACNLMGTFKLLTVYFTPMRFATLAAIVFSMGTVGNICAATPLVLLTEEIGWRPTFFLFAGVNLLLTILFFWLARDSETSVNMASPKEDGNGFHEMMATLRLLFQKSEYWIISFGTFCRYGVYAAIQSLYAGPYLITAQELPIVTAGNIILVMNIGFIIGGPIFGSISDRILKSRKWVVIPGLASLASLLAILGSLPPNTDPIFLGMLFFLIGAVNSTGGIMYSHIKERMPLNMAGTAMTGINFFTMIGPAVFLQGLSSLMQYYYPLAPFGVNAFETIFYFSAICLVVVGCIYLFTRDTSP